MDAVTAARHSTWKQRLSSDSPWEWWARRPSPADIFVLWIFGKIKWPGWPGLHSRKLIWNLKMMVSNRNLLFQVSFFGCHVSFRGRTNIIHNGRQCFIFLLQGCRVDFLTCAPCSMPDWQLGSQSSAFIGDRCLKGDLLKDETVFHGSFGSCWSV